MMNDEYVRNELPLVNHLNDLYERKNAFNTSFHQVKRVIYR